MKLHYKAKLHHNQRNFKGLLVVMEKQIAICSHENFWITTGKKPTDDLGREMSSTSNQTFIFMPCM